MPQHLVFSADKGPMKSARLRLNFRPPLMAARGSWPLLSKWARLVGQVEKPERYVSVTSVQSQLAKLLDGRSESVERVNRIRSIASADLPVLLDSLEGSVAAEILDCELSRDIETQLRLQSERLQAVLKRDQRAQSGRLWQGVTPENQLNEDLTSVATQVTETESWTRQIIFSFDQWAQENLSEQWDLSRRTEFVERVGRLSKSIQGPLYFFAKSEELFIPTLHSLGLIDFVQDIPHSEPASPEHVEAVVTEVEGLHQRIFNEDIACTREDLLSFFGKLPQGTLELFDSGYVSDFSRLMLLRHWGLGQIPSEEVAAEIYASRH